MINFRFNITRLCNRIKSLMHKNDSYVDSVDFSASAPNDIESIDDRQDPNGEEYRVFFGYVNTGELSKALEEQGYCKERIDRFLKRYGFNEYYFYPTFYI